MVMHDSEGKKTGSDQGEVVFEHLDCWVNNPITAQGVGKEDDKKHIRGQKGRPRKTSFYSLDRMLRHVHHVIFSRLSALKMNSCVCFGVFRSL